MDGRRCSAPPIGAFRIPRSDPGLTAKRTRSRSRSSLAELSTMAGLGRPDIHNSVSVASRHLGLDELLHEQVFLDSTPQLVGLGGVEMHELLELE